MLRIFKTVFFTIYPNFITVLEEFIKNFNSIFSGSLNRIWISTKRNLLAFFTYINYFSSFNLIIWNHRNYLPKLKHCWLFFLNLLFLSFQNWLFLWPFVLSKTINSKVSQGVVIFMKSLISFIWKKGKLLRVNFNSKL